MSSRWYPRRALLLSPISTTSRIVSSCLPRGENHAGAGRWRSARVVVGGLDGHLDVVRVALLEPGRGDPDEPGALVHLGDRRRPDVAHARAQAADQLLGHG